MKILLTNDDGIQADGIFAIYNELKKIASVVIVAPDSERSSVSHGITLSRPLWIKKIKRKGKLFGYGVSGTPADCVKFAIGVLLKNKKPDLIVSGINLGPNDGCSVFYSGTVAAAREGAILGIPSMAVSLGTFSDPHFNYAAKLGAKLAKFILKNKLPKGTFLNVNVPNKSASKIKGIRITRQGTIPIHGRFKRHTDSSRKTYYWLSGHLAGFEKNLDIDTYALINDYASITPIHCDSTDYNFYAQLSHSEIKSKLKNIK